MTTVRDIFGMACPSCGSDEHLRVVVQVTAELSTDGTEPLGDHEWDDDSACLCDRCEFTGHVGQFRVGEAAS